MTHPSWWLRVAVLACAAMAPAGLSAEPADVGQPAPEFSLTDLDGRPRSLSEWRGKIVVLEWFNPDCPFVRKHYDSKNLPALQRRYMERGVVWVLVNSSAPNKQGHYPPDAFKSRLSADGSSPTAMLLDPDGTAGRAYGAKTTPHLFIIDAEGVLRYAGAIDDRPSTEASDIAGARNYVAEALDALLNGQPVPVATTTSYGCSVKYGS